MVCLTEGLSGNVACQFEQVFKLRRGVIGGVLTQHFVIRCNGVAIGGQFVLLLHVVAGQTGDVALTIAPQGIAHSAKERADHHIYQVVPTHIEVGRSRCYTESNDLFTQRFVGRSSLWKAMLQPVDFLIDTMAQLLKRFLRMMKIDAAQFDHGRKVGKRELAEHAILIAPNIPHQERENDFGESRHKTFKIEKMPIVERGHHAYVVERSGVALKILNGIDMSVEHERRGAEQGAGGCGSLHEVVVVGIDTSNHVRAEPIGKRDFLAAPQGGARGEHHLEFNAVVFNQCEEVVPKENVVVALDIDHNFVARRSALQAVGSRDIGRIEVGSEVGR